MGFLENRLLKERDRVRDEKRRVREGEREINKGSQLDIHTRIHTHTHTRTSLRFSGLDVVSLGNLSADMRENICIADC